MGCDSGSGLESLDRAGVHDLDVQLAGAHGLVLFLVSKYPVTSLSPITLLSPLFGITFGVTLLHDQLTARMLVGGAVTLIGVFIVVMREKRLVDTGT